MMRARLFPSGSTLKRYRVVLLLSASFLLFSLMTQTYAETPSPSSSAIAYPTAQTVDQVDDYFGTKVLDPYRWMEAVDSPEIKTWVDAQNTLTRSVLDQVPTRDAIRDRILHLNSFERYTVPARRGSRYFYTHNEGLQNQNVVFWQEGLHGIAHVLLDPNTMKADGTVALGGMALTEDGTLAAYALTDAGSDWLTWHVREVATGKDLPDQIHWSKFSNASWLPDNSGFFYSAYAAPDEVHQAEFLKSTNYFHKLFLHKLGTPQSADRLIFDRSDDRELNLGGSVTDDGRYLLIYQSKGTSPNNELAVLPLTPEALADPHSHVIHLVDKADAQYTLIDNDGPFLWIQTTLDAPKGKVIGIDLTHIDAKRPADRSTWKSIIPETTNALDSVSMVHETLIASYLADAQSRIELHSRGGALIQTLDLPGIGTTGGFTGRRTDTETFFAFTNFTTPPTIYRLDLTTLKSTPYREPKLLFKPSDFETRQVFATSKDGTRVPIFLSCKKGLKLDGSNPTLLYGYGGFNISMVPAFAPSRIAWMELGGIYAQAVLRGGGEYGEDWHLAGTGIHKQNVFDDFIASAEYLIGHNYTSPKKLAIQGGSNGGLLVAAVEIQRPELFGAVLAEVGVMDMLRFDKFTIGWAWKQDYGGPSDSKSEFDAIYKYSPLHNIRHGVHYPPTLITTGDHDDRVFPAHSFKYAAALQAACSTAAAAPSTAAANGTAASFTSHPANPACGPILIRIETRAGHGSATPLTKRVDNAADQFAFLVQHLGVSTTTP
ncbi:MAG: prolyl oligopeptidase family serine peptidase [Acidobacteriaceae bacterium]